LKLRELKTELSADGMTGKIQLGAVPGSSAQVIVPAFFVPLDAASGTEPIEPGTLTALPFELLDPPPLPLLLQAARAVTLATVTASPAIALLLRSFIGPPSLRSLRLVSVLGSSACRPSLAVLPVIRSRRRRGTGSQ
jgi:hypothetical protein